MKIQTETITWLSVELPNRPDVDTDVIIYSENGELVIGFWDDEYGQWLSAEGDDIVNAVAWAAVEGPEA